MKLKEAVATLGMRLGVLKIRESMSPMGTPGWTQAHQERRALELVLQALAENQQLVERFKKEKTK